MSAMYTDELNQAARPQGLRILAEGELVTNDTWETNLNNNDLVVGSTGAGKTRHYVTPNLLQMNESFIVTDTKGLLRKEVGPVLADHGYRVIDVDFTDMAHSYGYNPFDAIHIDEVTGKVCEQDVMSLAHALVPIENFREPFWDYATRNLLASYIGYIMESLRAEDHHVGSIAALLAGSCSENDSGKSKGATEVLLDEYADSRPCSLTARKWGAFKATTGAEKMYASILGILSEKIDPFTFDGALQMFTSSERIELASLGQEKTALFVTVSDTDRSMDRAVSLFYAQALHELCRFADNECANGALPVPVRLYLDDFATNCRIEGFDKVISVIRSRNIAVSVVLQSISQLETLYTQPEAETIVNGCDHMLYLGGQDVRTAEMVGVKARKTRETVLDMPVDQAWLFERGTRAKQVRRYDLTRHPLYDQLSEAGNTSDWPASRKEDSTMAERDTDGELLSIDELFRCFESDADEATACETRASAGLGSGEEICEAEGQGSNLEELISQASQRTIMGTAQSAASENNLLKTETQRLVQLVEIIARIAPVQGAGRELGFLEPRKALAAKLKGMTPDDVDMWELDQIWDIANETAVFWEGERVMQGLPLARNVLLHAVFSDQELRDMAYQRAERMLERCAKVCGQSSLKLV